jgi:hypothetical protein
MEVSMLDSTGRSSGLWHAAADVILATVAGGLVLLFFYPITLCAAGVKGLRPARRASGNPHRQSVA